MDELAPEQLHETKFLIGCKYICTGVSKWKNSLQTSCMRQSFLLAVNALVPEFLIGRTSSNPLHEPKFLIGCLYTLKGRSDWTNWLQHSCLRQSCSLAVNTLKRTSDWTELALAPLLFPIGCQMLESELSDWKNAVQPPSWRAGRTCRAASTRSSWRTPGTTATPTPRQAHPSTICSPHQDTVSHVYFCLQTIRRSFINNFCRMKRVINNHF